MEDEENLDEAYDEGYEGGLSVADAESMLGQTEDYGEPSAPGSGLSYLGLPGYDVAMEKLIESNDQARAALRQAREKLAARKYNSAIGLLAVSGALLSPTRSGGFSESMGNAANAMIGPLQAKDAFEQNRDKELLGIDTSLAGLDQSTAKAHLDLAKLRAELAAKEAALPNDRVVLPNGDVVFRARPEARRPGYEAWTPKGTQINVGDKEEDYEEREVGQYHGKVYGRLLDAGEQAEIKIGKYRRMENLLEGAKTSKLTPLATDIASIAEFFGIKIDPQLGEKQAADALMKEVALTLRNPSGGAGMPGALSNQDREYLAKMAPGLAQSPEGRKLIIETAIKLEERARQVARLARNYRAQNKKKTGKGIDEGFFDMLEDWSAKNPLFPKESAEAAEAEAAAEELATVTDEAAAVDSRIPALLRRPGGAAPAVAVPAIPSADEAAATQPGTISFYDLPRRK